VGGERKCRTGAVRAQMGGDSQFWSNASAEKSRVEGEGLGLDLADRALGSMSCSLSSDQLAVLKYLVEHRSVRADRAKRLEAIKRDLDPKGINAEDVLDSMLGTYVAKTPKQSKIHYYVNLGPTLTALKAHNLWRPGREHPI
jgi:hypothetical protein